MKKLLIVLLFGVLISCSPSDDGAGEELKPEADYTIFVMDACPDHNVITYHGVDNANFKKVEERYKAANTYCVYIDFKNIKGETVTGYYGGHK